jgi:hypothetical protein
MHVIINLLFICKMIFKTFLNDVFYEGLGIILYVNTLYYLNYDVHFLFSLFLSIKYDHIHLTLLIDASV